MILPVNPNRRHPLCLLVDEFLRRTTLPLGLAPRKPRPKLKFGSAATLILCDIYRRAPSRRPEHATRTLVARRGSPLDKFATSQIVRRFSQDAFIGRELFYSIDEAVQRVIIDGKIRSVSKCIFSISRAR